MTLSLLSLNYKTTPVELREKLAISAAHLPEIIQEARQGADLEELMILSTCNRVEYYLVDNPEGNGTARLAEWLNHRFLVEPGELDHSALFLDNQSALTHLFRVACALESMVVGEPQILGQLKDAFRLACEAGTVGAELTGLMPKVFRTAKRVRTETGISRFAVSVSHVAADLAARIFDTLEDKTVLVIGAGEMAELALSNLRRKGINRLLITNRTFANGVALAEKFEGEAVRYESMPEHLAQADIVISSTGARGYVIDQEMVRQAVKTRRGNPMFFIDIAVPRNIDPKVNDLADAYLYDIDDLQEAADSNRKEREREAHAAQEIITEEIARYGQWKSAGQVTPLVTALREHFTTTGKAELEKTLSRLRHLNDQDAEQIRKLVHSMVNKLLHLPSTRLKVMSDEPNAGLYSDIIRQMFDLSPLAEAAPEGESGTGKKSGPAPDKKIVNFPPGRKS
ncbi:MAG: glutamyl-tRNA reductase [Deltaproteobacteria bacterium]|nr:glutamyl-tRNA reductase [Deltaproteobacteria bacterium]